MRGCQKNQIAAIAIVVTCIIGFVLIDLSVIPTGDEIEGEFLSEFSGYYYM
jgi:hypothetical protein